MQKVKEFASDKEMVPSDFSGIFLYSQALEIETLLFGSLLHEPFLATFNDSLIKSGAVIFLWLKTHGVLFSISNYGEAFAPCVQKDQI